MSRYSSATRSNENLANMSEFRVMASLSIFFRNGVHDTTEGIPDDRSQ